MIIVTLSEQCAIRSRRMVKVRVSNIFKESETQVYRHRG